MTMISIHYLHVRKCQKSGKRDGSVVKALVILPEHPDLIPSTQTESCNYICNSSSGGDTLSGLYRHQACKS